MDAVFPVVLTYFLSTYKDFRWYAGRLHGSLAKILEFVHAQNSTCTMPPNPVLIVQASVEPALWCGRDERVAGQAGYDKGTHGHKLKLGESGLSGVTSFVSLVSNRMHAQSVRGIRP